MAFEFVQNKNKIPLNTVKLVYLTGSVLALSACGGGSGGNTAPAVSNASLTLTTPEDSAVSGVVTATDADGDTLGFSVGVSPSNGSLTVSQDGSFTYTPSANFYGNDAASILVSDSIDSVSVSLSFTISNVNDLPIIETSSLVVGSNGQTMGVVEATDIDGDALTFSVSTQPTQGVVEIDPTTGEFTFTANELATVDDSFVVSVTDGIGEPVLGTISLGASYVSNEDKLTYYYASSHSHIAQASAMIERENSSDTIVINDAELAIDAYSNIAIGYAQAGFAELSLQTIDEKVITRKGKADALRESANKLQATGNSEKAATFRTQALIEQNAYLAEIGLENLATSDSQFYRALVNDYLAADDFNAAQTVLNVTQAYADELSDLTQERTSAHGRFSVLASELLAERVEAYSTDQSDINFNSVIVALDYATYIADTTSFNEVGGNNYFTSRTLALVEAARYAYVVSLIGNETQRLTLKDKAKTLLARGISMYVPANYDAKYTFDVADYASETLRRYPTGIGLLAGPFAALYPEYVEANSTETTIGNLPLMLVEEEEGARDSDTKKAYRDHYAYRIVSAAGNGEDISPIIEQLTETFTTTYDDTVYVVEALLEQDDNGFIDKRAGWFLHYAGFDLQAQEVAVAAINTLSTEAYFNDVGYNVDGLVENQGCSRFVELYVTFGGSATTQAALQAQCIDVVNMYFGEDSAASNVQMMNAWVNAASIQQALGNNEAATAALNTALQAVEAQEDIDDLFAGRIYIANAYASLGFLDTAAAHLTAISNDAITTVSNAATVEDRVEALDDILDELEDVFSPDDSNGFLNIDHLLYATKKQAGINSEYAEAISSMKATGKTMLDSLLATTTSFADSEKVDFYEVFIEQYGWLGEQEAAIALSTSDVYTDTDSETLFAVIAETLAVKDDFPATTIANVDTDLDGLPNFFLQNVTDEAITQSGLSVDNDADNDGIEDPNDINPLDKD